MTAPRRLPSESAPLARQASRNERWKRNFNESREARGLTHQEIASALGVSIGAVRKWAQGESRPTLDKAVGLADVLGVARVRVLDWADLVPGVADLTLYVEQLQNHMTAAERTRSFAPVGGVRGVGHLAYALAEKGQYSFKIVPWWRGTGQYRRHFADWTIIEDGPDSLSQETVQLQVNEAFIYTASYWNGAEDWSHCLKPPRRDLVICTPRFIDLRQGRGDRRSAAPRSIAVMGQHWCGHAEAARFLADALDYDFASAGVVAASVFGSLPHDWGAAGWRRDRREVVRTYSLDAELGRSRVWSADIWEDVDALEIALGQPRLPFIVYLRPSDEVIGYAARMRVRCGMTELQPREEAQRIRDTRRIVEGLLRDAESVRPRDGGPRSLTVQVDLPEDAENWDASEPPCAVDAWFDRYAQTAAAVVRKLFGLRFAPGAGSAAFNVTDALARAGLK